MPVPTPICNLIRVVIEEDLERTERRAAFDALERYRVAMLYGHPYPVSSSPAGGGHCNTGMSRASFHSDADVSGKTLQAGAAPFVAPVVGGGEAVGATTSAAGRGER
jgi:hypothetical protein